MAKLAPYRAKRDFTKTAEPQGGKTRRRGSSFVVQKHDASRLHYDFRLELDGVLKSWAVAKGPSLVKGEKRLAVHVEDHPVDYGGFEGTIPEGQYGGGTVLLWDRGTWQPEGDPHEGYEKGRLSFRLDGEKLRGTWHLIRMAKRPRERQESWLLIKAEDEFARGEDDPDILEEAPLSVASGRTIEDLSGETKAPSKARPAAKKTAGSKAGTPSSAKKGSSPAKTAKNDRRVVVAGVSLSNPDRVLWEEQGLTKQQLAEFYVGIADWILPHVVDRPLTLIRCPSGAQTKCFVQRHSWAGLSEFIHREMVPDDKDGEQEALAVRDIRGVVALVQSGVLEMHVWGATLEDLERPDRLILDLDPGEGVDFPLVIEGALAVRERLKTMGLESFVKTTGGKGLHVVVPLKPRAPWKDALTFTRGLAEAMAADEPDRYTTTSVKSEREGRIFIDYLRNNREASAVAPYSTRARPGAPVATPVSWDELSPRLKPNGFTVSNLGERLRTLKKDPWAEMAKVDQVLPEATRTRGKSKE